MELRELQVRHPATGPPGHGDAVAGRGWRRGRGAVHLAGAAGGEHDVRRDGVEHGSRPQVQQPRPAAGRYGAARLARQQQVHGAVMLQQRDAALPAGAAAQRGHDGAAGRIRRMRDAALPMAAFASEMQAFALRGERDALPAQPGDGAAGPGDDLARGRQVAQPAPAASVSLHVRVHAVARGQRRGDAALRAIAGAVGQRALGHEGHAAPRRQFQRGGQAGQAAADDDDVEFHAPGLR